MSRKMEWKPIDTAPNDGTIFTACRLVSRTSYAGGRAEDNWMVSDARWQDGKFRFRSVMDGDPSHWMPFNPPSE